MSLYACLDRIEKKLGMECRENSVFHAELALLKVKESPMKAYSDLLKDLGETLCLRVAKDEYFGLEKEIAMIEQFFLSNKKFSKDDCLNFILSDLKKTKELFEVNQARGVPPEADHAHIKFQIAKPCQAYRVGSRGECYGFVHAMVDPRLSPYKNQQVLSLELNEKVHSYHKYQSHRLKDQFLIKNSRLTREYFCPHPRQQAQAVFDFAKKNVGKELGLYLRSSVGPHACYISLQEDAKIRCMMDFNDGAYLFKKREDFIDYYVAELEKCASAGIHYRFYSLAELIYDPKQELLESKTLKGKMRTLLTGPKYPNAFFQSSLLVFHGLIGLVFMRLLNPLISLEENLKESLPILLALLFYIAFYKGHRGLLSLPHLIQDTWCSLKESTDPSFSQPSRNFFYSASPPFIQDEVGSISQDEVENDFGSEVGSDSEEEVQSDSLEEMEGDLWESRETDSQDDSEYDSNSFLSLK